MVSKLPRLKKLKNAGCKTDAFVNDIPTFSCNVVKDRIEIGRGSFATAYCGKYSNDNEVVLKIMHDIEDEDGSKAIFLKEARLLNSLNHKNIVSFLRCKYYKHTRIAS